METNQPQVINDAQVYQSVRGFVVEAYWKIGQAISEACGGSERAA